MGLVDDFINAADRYYAAMNELERPDVKRVASQTPAAEEYNDLLTTGRRWRPIVDFLYDQAGGNDMQAWPLIPIAITAAGVALITKWVTDAMSLSDKMDEVKRLTAQGIPPAQAYNMVGSLDATKLSLPGIGLLAAGLIGWTVLK